MNIVNIIFQFVKKIIQAIYRFFKIQIEFIKKTWKAQGLKGILILTLNLIIAFFGGLVYEKINSKKSRGRRTDNTTERGCIRQSSNTGRQRNINDNIDECGLRGITERRKDRDSKRDISDNMREPPEAGEVFKGSNSKGKRDNTDDTGKPKTQRGKNSERDINPQRRIKD